MSFSIKVESGEVTIAYASGQIQDGTISVSGHHDANGTHSSVGVSSGGGEAHNLKQPADPPQDG